MDRLKQLQVFVAVAEAESFIGGARQLGVSGPVVTRAINKLEAHLGAKLFTRTTRAVRLTQVGTRYLVDCREVLEALRAADDAVTGSYGAPVGRLRITAPHEFGVRHVAPLLPEFLAAWPRVDVEAVFTDRVVDMVGEGVEVALRIGDLPDSSLMARRLGHVREIVCASPSYAPAASVSTPADLAALDLIVSRAITPTSEWRFGKDVVRLRPRMVSNTVAGAVAAATAGWGITRVLSYQACAELIRGDLVILLEDFEAPPVPVHIVHTGGRVASARARLLVDFLADRISAQEDLAHILGLPGRCPRGQATTPRHPARPAPPRSE